MPSSRQSVAVALGLGLAASVLVSTPAVATPGGTGLVISEVYGGGGNTGAQYTNDFVELYNPTSSAVTGVVVGASRTTPLAPDMAMLPVASGVGSAADGVVPAPSCTR